MLCSGLCAQNMQDSHYFKSPEVGKWEVEWMILGFATPLEKNGYPSYDGGIQVRHNIPGTAWSYGGYIGLCLMGHEETFSYTHFDEQGNLIGETSDTKASLNGGLLTGVVGEYDFLRGRKINPYINISAGLGWFTRPYIRPSIGVELYHHLRLGVAATWLRQDPCAISFNLSLVFGGSPK